MTLSEIAPGVRFTVAKVKVAGEMGRRLADMGFTEGSAGEMVRDALLRGPMQVRLSGYDLLIRRSEAACIEVRPEKGAGTAA
jgi:ferrous iron transport protein A